MGSADLFRNWRLADQAAMAATQFTVAKSMLALDGMGEPPSQDETQAVRMLRRVADAQFNLAMVRMDQLSQADGGRRASARPATSAP